MVVLSEMNDERAGGINKMLTLAKSDQTGWVDKMVRAGVLHG